MLETLPVSSAFHPRQTTGVDLTEDLVAACTPEVLFSHVSDLTTYPAWLAIVERAVPHPPGTGMDLGVRADGDGSDAWLVDLRGRLGPMARSKRLRMVRTAFDPPRHVRFERIELDGRNHAPWVLEATVTADGDGARLQVHLHYGGTFGGALLGRMLADEVERARPRLAALVATDGPAGGGEQDDS